eukprot:jgi/Bigna1/88545/estExt_fgenesh1_pg.C_330140
MMNEVSSFDEDLALYLGNLKTDLQNLEDLLREKQVQDLVKQLERERGAHKNTKDELSQLQMRHQSLLKDHQVLEDAKKDLERELKRLKGKRKTSINTSEAKSTKRRKKGKNPPAAKEKYNPPVEETFAFREDEQKGDQYYETEKDNETLKSIAKKLGLNAEELFELNKEKYKGLKLNAKLQKKTTIITRLLQLRLVDGTAAWWNVYSGVAYKHDDELQYPLPPLKEYLRFMQ